MKNVKSTIFIAWCTCFLLAWPVSSSAAATGKALFAQKCLNCHVRGGEAPVIKPAKYAAIQWERFFNKQKHVKKYKDISGDVSESELTLVLNFLIKHAADSEKPEA